jgi:hypothetical protein
VAQVRHHEAHEHGKNLLNVGIEGDEVVVELHGPMVNFVGFEHAPSTDDEKRLYADALSVLKNPASFLTFRGSSCTSRASTVTEPAFAADEKHDDGAHGKEHHDGDDDDDDDHADISANYEFRCADLGKLTSLDVDLFGRFPGTREVDVNVVGAEVQTSAVLTPPAVRVSLR